jgi:hypothetical protein
MKGILERYWHSSNKSKHAGPFTRPRTEPRCSNAIIQKVLDYETTTAAVGKKEGSGR